MVHRLQFRFMFDSVDCVGGIFSEYCRSIKRHLSLHKSGFRLVGLLRVIPDVNVQA